MKPRTARIRQVVTTFSALLLVAGLGACGDEQTAGDFRERALALQAEGDLAASVIEFANAINLAPDDPELRYLAGKAYLELGNAPAAVRELSRAVEIGSEQADAAELLAAAQRFVALQDGLPATILALRKDLLDNPDDAAARLRLARAYLELGSGAAAETELRRLLEAEPYNLELLADLGRALLLQGAYDRVLEDYANVVGGTREEKAEFLILRGQALRGKNDDDAARQLYGEALDVLPTYAPALLALADLEADARRFDVAAELIERSADGVAHDEAKWLEEKANLALLRGDLAAAEELYARTLALKPHRLIVQRNLARAQLGQQKYTEALRNVEAILASTPNDAETTYIRAAAAYHLGDDEAAIEFANRTTSLSNAHPHAFFLAGAANYRAGRLQQAVAALETYVVRVPADEAGRVYLANALVQLQNYRRALEVLQPLAGARANDVDFLEFVASVARRAGELEQADALLSRATALQPDDAQLRSRLGIVKIALGDSESGVGELRKAIEIDPERPELLLQVILENIRMGRFDAALADAKRYQEQHPDKAQGWLLAGIAHNGKNETVAAWQSFEHVLTLLPGHPGASAGLAEIAAKERRFDAARGFLEESLAKFPEQPETYINLARVEHSGGRPDAAIDWLEKGLEVLPENADLRITLADAYRQARRPMVALQALAAVTDVTADLLAVRGAAELQAARLDEAVRTFTERAQLTPDDPTAHVQLAEAALLAGQLALAREHAREAVRLQPESSAAGLALARVEIAGLGAASTREEAQAVTTDVRALYDAQPNAPAVGELRGLYFAKFNQPERAVPLLQAAQERLNNSFTLVRLATAQQEAGDVPGAVATLSAWLDAYPEDQYVRFALARLAFGRADYELAALQMREILARDPSRTTVYSPLAEALMRTDRLAEAAEYARLAYAEQPYDPTASEVLAVVHLEDGNPERALAILKPVADASPGYPSLRFRYAQALSGVGDVAAARTVLESLLAEATAFPERPQAEALLAGLPEAE